MPDIMFGSPFERCGGMKRMHHDRTTVLAAVNVLDTLGITVPKVLLVGICQCKRNSPTLAPATIWV